MIRIDKTGIATPKILLDQGTQKHNSHVIEYENDPVSFSLNTRQRTKFIFDSETYGNEEVKVLLKTLQGHKCCFCEAKITHTSHGHIEHFRPKACYRQDDATQIVYPGYYWLAYDWNNLYFACEKCNGRPNKGNYFPLSIPANRACPRARNIDIEEPLFIDLGLEDPQIHICFSGPDPESKSHRGFITIRRLGLDREELVEHRRSKFNLLNALKQIMEINADSIPSKEIFLNQLRLCVHPESEYSSMVQSNFNNFLVEL